MAEPLVAELDTHALVHAGSRFRLALFAAHGVLRCEVADTERRVPRVLDAGTGENGRGMLLVDALAQRWGCHRDGPGKTCGSRSARADTAVAGDSRDAPLGPALAVWPSRRGLSGQAPRTRIT